MAKSSHDIKKLGESDGTCRIWNGDDFIGTTVLYAATKDDLTCFQCDFEIASLQESCLKETRAYRNSLRARGREVSRLPANRLHHELVVLFGAEMSAADAVAALKHLTKNIQKRGLLIGRDEKDNFVTEMVDGSTVL